MAMDLAARIREAIEHSGLSQSDIARRTGNTTGAVSQWLDGTIKSLKARNALALEAATGYRAQWIAQGTGEKKVSASNVARVHTDYRRIPVLNEAQVAAWLDGTSPPDTAQIWLGAEAMTGEAAFALAITGRSMEPQFNQGDRIIVDPDAAPAAGDHVVVETPHGTLFRKYRMVAPSADGKPPVFEVVPVNPDHPVLRSDSTIMRILGVMVEHRIYRRS